MRTKSYPSQEVEERSATEQKQEKSPSLRQVKKGNGWRDLFYQKKFWSS